MNVTNSSTKYIVGVLLWSAAASSFAVSLGRLQGATEIGRPFDATLTIGQSGDIKNIASLCVNAEVSYGDSKLSSSVVRTSITAGAISGDALVRIQATSPVNEPVVTVIVNEGCLQKSTRKYVLLAEPVGSSSAAVVGSGISSQSVLRLAKTLPSLQGSAKATRTGSRAAPKSDVANVNASLNNGDAGQSSVSAAAGAASLNTPRAVKTSAKASRSSLKLDFFDLTAGRDPVLRGSPEMLSTPSEDAQQKTTAAALWQAISAQPEDVLRNNQKLQLLEEDVPKVLAQRLKTEASMAQLRRELDQAREERYQNWLVYGLGILVPLLLLLAYTLWNKQRSMKAQGQWWNNDPLAPNDANVAEDTGVGVNANVGVEVPVKEATVRQVKPAAWDRAIKPKSLPKTKAEPEFDASISEPDVFPGAKETSEPKKRTMVEMPKISAPVQVAAEDFVDFSHSLTSLNGTTRVVNVEELFDVQQQADFFLSLGNADKAVEVLRHHISENAETSAMAYLDLFDIFHNFGRQADYEVVRKDFNDMFNAQVPAFDDYATESHGLEFYTAALSRIESLWPTPKVLDVIEESIFRKPGSGDEAFSLPAYRELLLLHAIAKKVVQRPVRAKADSSAYDEDAHADFGHTEIHPLSTRSSESDLTRPPASRRIGLDVDLSSDYEESVVTMFGAPLDATVPSALETSAKLNEVKVDDSHDSNLIEFQLGENITTSIKKS